jgi:hypothetical protein
VTKGSKRSGRKYNRGRYWIRQRDAAFARAGDFCEITGAKLVGRAQVVNQETSEVLHTAECWERACHHVIAERWVRSFVKKADVHCLENLVVVSPSLHAKLTAAENKLFRADWIGYKSELNRIGFPPELLDRAMTALCASVKEKRL